MTPGARSEAGTVRSCRRRARGTPRGSSGRSPPCRPRPARPTAATSRRSSSGPSARCAHRARAGRAHHAASLPRVPRARAATRPARSPRARLGAAPVLRVAARTGRIEADPASGLHAPKGESRLPRVLRRDELEVLLDEPPAAVDGDDEAIRLRDDAVLELLYGSGLRVAELCGLGAERPRHCAPAPSPSGARASKQRKVPMSEPAVEAVTGVAAAGPRAPGPRGEPG